MFLQIYTALFLGLTVFALGGHANDNDEEKFFTTILRTILLFPIFGRIFGWW